MFYVFLYINSKGAVIVMNKEYLPETQFSIYKIDFEEVENKFKIKHKSLDESYVEEIVEALINGTKKILDKKTNSISFHVKYTGFSGLIFKTIHNPVWKEVAQQIISGNEIKMEKKSIPPDFLTNSNVSYLLFYKQDDNLYAVTGGYGSNYVSKFTSKNFGLYLLPKIIKRDNPVLKQILENNLTGNQASTSRANRKSTSFILEQDMSSIFRQLCVEVDRDVATALGISFSKEEPTGKKVNIINKDSLVIRRSFTLNDLKKVIGKVCRIEKNNDNFALNYLVLAKKRGIKNSELLDILIQNLQEEKIENFMLVGDEYENYFVNADKYIIATKDEETYLSCTEPITIFDLFQKFKEEDVKLTKSFLSAFLKHWRISTLDNSGNTIMFPLSIFDALQGFVEFKDKGTFCYLFNGNWYVFDATYDKILLQEYKELYDKKKVEADAIKLAFGLKKDARTEDRYNRNLYKIPNLIVAHTALLKNVEIADVIFWNSTKIYLMHNKMKFDGSGTRDLTNQILTAAEYIQKKMSSIERNAFLREYYKEIKKKYNKEKQPLKTSEEDFVNAFSSKEICFIAGYLKDYKKTTRSTYSRYLTIELNRKLARKSFGYIPMGILD